MWINSLMTSIYTPVTYAFWKFYLFRINNWLDSSTLYEISLSYLIILFILSGFVTSAMISGITDILPNRRIVSIFKKDKYKNYSFYIFDRVIEFFVLFHIIYDLLFVSIAGSFKYLRSSPEEIEIIVFVVLAFINIVRSIFFYRLYVRAFKKYKIGHSVFKNDRYTYILVTDELKVPDMLESPETEHVDNENNIIAADQHEQIIQTRYVAGYIYITDNDKMARSQAVKLSNFSFINGNPFPHLYVLIITQIKEKEVFRRTGKRYSVNNMTINTYGLPCFDYKEIEYLGVGQYLKSYISEREWRWAPFLLDGKDRRLMETYSRFYLLPKICWNYYVEIFSRPRINNAIKILLDGIYVLYKITLCVLAPVNDSSWLKKEGSEGKGRKSIFENYFSSVTIMYDFGISEHEGIVERYSTMNLFTEKEIAWLERYYCKKNRLSDSVTLFELTKIITYIRNIIRHYEVSFFDELGTLINILITIHIALVSMLPLFGVDLLTNEKNNTVTLSINQIPIKSISPMIVFHDSRLFLFTEYRNSKYIYIDYFTNKRMALAPSFIEGDGCKYYSPSIEKDDQNHSLDFPEKK